MDLIIRNNSLEKLGIVDVKDTLIWVRRYADIGSFELTAPATANNLYLLQKKNIVQKDNDLEVGYINSIFIEANDDAPATIKVTGLLYSGLLNQRCVLTNAANLKMLIENNLRGLSNINVDALCSEITFDNDFTGEYLGTCVIALAKANGFGFKTVYNMSTSKIDFKIYYGVDKSVEQNINPFVIFSDTNECLVTCEYTHSDSEVVNVVYARCKALTGVQNPEAAPIYDLVNGTGDNAFEKYIEVEPITFDTQVTTDDGTVTYSWIDASSTLLQMQSLAENELVEPQENFQGTVDFKYNYKIDYDIGDIVTIRCDKWGKSITQRVTEVTEVYDNQNDAINPTFGNPAVTILDILKKVK